MSRTPERILQAAEAVLVRKGVDGARMREIASAAGVNPALLHYHFGTKEELSRLVLRRVVRRSVGPILHAWSAADPPQVNVPRVLRACTEEFRSRRDVPGFLLSALHREPALVHALMASLGEGLEGAGPPGREVVRRLEAQLRRHGARGIGPASSAVQVLINLLALCLIPFAARPALEVALGRGDLEFDRLLDRHVDRMSAFILRGLDLESPTEPWQGRGR